MKEHYLLGEVAKEIGRKPYQVAYMLTNGFAEEPKLRIGGKRIFTRPEIEGIRKVMDAKYGQAEARNRRAAPE